MKEVIDVMFPNEPIFPDGIAGKQGYLLRHLWMVTAVTLKADLPTPMTLLEIGSWVGFSALTWAEAIRLYVPQKGTILCVDPWVQYLPEADQNRAAHYQGMHQAGQLDIAYSVFRHNIATRSGPVRIDHFRGRSRDVLPYLSDRQFDIVFIDGAHGYEDVKYDVAQARRLVKDGGFICGDDLELQMHEIDPTFAQAHREDDYLEDPKTGKPYHPGVAVAVDEAFGPVTSYTGFWIIKAKGQSFEPVVFTTTKTFIPSHFDEKYKGMIMEALKSMGLYSAAAQGPGTR